MNVTGVGATPPPQPVPPVPAPTATASTTPDSRRHEPGAGEGRGRQPSPAPAEVRLPETPPLRMLTVTEMRVMLGQLPASAALRRHGEVDVRGAYS